MDTEPATETVTVDRSMELRRRVEATRQAALDAKQNYEQALQTWDRSTPSTAKETPAMNQQMNTTASRTGIHGDADWIEWVTDLEETIGHDLDGDQQADGYSLDWVYQLWKKGHSVANALEAVTASKRELPS